LGNIRVDIQARLLSKYLRATFLGPRAAIGNPGSTAAARALLEMITIKNREGHEAADKMFQFNTRRATFSSRDREHQWSHFGSRPE
jgi:hypothetical protein